MRGRGSEGAGHRRVERIVRRVVRPQCKHAAGMQMFGKPGKPWLLVQRGVALSCGLPVK